MKFTIILFAVVAAALADQDIHNMPKETRDRLKRIGVMCADDNGLNHTVIAKLVDGTLPRDEATNKFLYCFTLTSGYIVEDGHMVIETIADLFKGYPRVEDLKAALRKCNEVTKEDPIATVVEMNKCFTKAPVRLVL